MAARTVKRGELLRLLGEELGAGLFALLGGVQALTAFLGEAFMIELEQARQHLAASGPR